MVTVRFVTVSKDTHAPQALADDPEHVDDPGCRWLFSHTPWCVKGRLNTATKCRV